MRKRTSGTATIEENAFCKDCGWTIIFSCCNEEMAELHPGDDWWMYCSNQGCKNHVGEPYNQGEFPSFLGYSKL